MSRGQTIADICLPIVIKSAGACVHNTVPNSHYSLYPSLSSYAYKVISHQKSRDRLPGPKQKEKAWDSLAMTHPKYTWYNVKFLIQGSVFVYSVIIHVFDKYCLGTESWLALWAIQRQGLCPLGVCTAVRKMDTLTLGVVEYV